MEISKQKKDESVDVPESYKSFDMFIVSR
jgi:hypothetical protein